MESKSKTSSFTSINNTTNNLLKNCDWLNDLLELHYFAYNSCNSLTIYSHKFWHNSRKLVVATKENNIKEVFFNQVEVVSENDQGTKVLSTQSSISSGNSNSNPNQATRKASSFESKSNMSINDSDGSYLEPVYKIHKLPKIKSKLEIN